MITTEKPSVANEYAKVLHINDRKQGYIIGYSDVLDENVCITWCYGHLCTLSYPEKYDERLKEWRLETLPFLPKEYKYEIIEASKAQFEVIKEIYNGKLFTVSKWLSAGDSGREGLYIQLLVRQKAGMASDVDERVVWIDSYTESEIIKGIKEAKHISEYDKQAAAAYMRAIEDYAVGINFSRALTIKFGEAYRAKAHLDKGSISVGRVMTCVLAMVVEREREIRDFVETSYYKVVAKSGSMESTWKAVETSSFFDSPCLYDENGFKESKDAKLLCENCSKEPTLKVESVKIVDERKKAPLLFNLAEIQNYCSNKYKISPDETLGIIQSLYEKKLVTYPRTDARVLSSAVASEISKNLNALIKLNYKTEVLRAIATNLWHKHLENTHYVDDSKITDHYAIIPTDDIRNAHDLTDLERAVYRDIIDRFLAIFFPAAVYEKAELVLVHSNGERFFTSEKTLKAEGYLEVYNYGLSEIPENRQIKTNSLSKIHENDIIVADFEVREGKTTPPKRYTSGSMVIAMENAGKLIEDEELRAQIKGAGIGTSATRAAIIEKLIRIHHIALNQKTQILTPLVAGECVYDIVKDVIPEFLTPEMTASWERGLAQMEEGMVTYSSYKEKLEDYVTKEVKKIKAKEHSGMSSYTALQGCNTANLNSITCPKCKKGHITENSKAFGCSEYKNGCDFVIWKQIAGKSLRAIDAERMLTKGRTSLIKGFKSKAGKTFNAKLLYKNGEISFEFEKKEN